MPIFLLLLLVGGAAVLVASGGGARNVRAPTLASKLSLHALPGIASAGTGLDAGLSVDQASAIHTAALHETRADRLEDFASSLPAGMPIAFNLLSQAAHTRSIGTTSATSRALPAMVGP